MTPPKPRAEQDAGRSAWLAGLTGLTLVLLLTALITSQGLTAPFDDSDQGWSGGYYGLAARNLARYPAGALLGAMCVEPGALVDAPLIYANHPPGVAWLVAAGFAVFGEGPLGARIGPWLLSIAAAGLAYGLLLRVLRRPLWAALGVALAVTTPAWTYYGSLPDPQGAGVLFAIFGACRAAAGWRLAGEPRARRRHALLCAAALLVGFAFDWPSYFAAVLLGLWAWGQPGGRRLAAGVAALTSASATLTAAWTAAVYARRGGGPDILEGLINRAGLKGLLGGGALADDVGNALTLSELVLGIGRHHLDVGFAPVSLAGLAAGALLWRSRRSLAGLLLVPVAAGALHVLVFPQGAYVHPYWQLYLAAGLALPVVWAACEVTPVRLRSGMVVVFLALNAASGARAWMRAEVRWGWTAEQREVFRDVGEAIRAATPPSARLVSGAQGHVALDYYGDRKIAWSGAERGGEPWDGLIAPPGQAPLTTGAEARWGPPEALPHGWRLWLAR